MFDAERLNEMAVFARVVEAHSFTAAAANLGLSKSAVSKQVTRLEDRLGARLLNRTTRRLSLTEAGAVFYERCLRIVEEAEAATDEVQALTGMMPEFVIREGKTREELLAHIAEDPSIAVLVLGAGDSKEGPGPLVSALAGQMSGTLPVPVTVVPGTLSREEIDAIS